MRLPCPVTVGSDNIMQIVMPNIHDYSIVALSPVGMTLESIGMPVRWPPGVAAGTAALAGSVRHLGSPIAQEAHDLGPLLWHLTVLPAPDPIFNPTKHLLQSECRFIFSNGEVSSEGLPTGCTSLFASPMPMMACGMPMDVPAMTAITNMGNSVIMGVHLVDFIAGWCAIVVQMALEVIVYVVDIVKRAMGRGAGRTAPHLSWGEFKFISKGGEVGTDGQWTNDVVTGLVRMIGRRFAGYRGEGLRLSSGNTDLTGDWNADGSARVRVSRRAGPGGVGGAAMQGARDAGGHYHVGGEADLGGYGVRGQATNDPSVDGPRIGDSAWRLEGAGTTDAWDGTGEDWDLSGLPEDLGEDDWLTR